MARTERVALCDTALHTGQDQPTLCGDWTVKDLVTHLLVRERSPGAVGIALSPLSGLTEREMRRVAKGDFAELVERLHGGPPPWSPYAVPKLDAMFNTLEFFVHHEDIRRAQPEWEPRDLTDDEQKLLWSMVRTAGKQLVRNAPVGVTLRNATTGSEAVLKEPEGDAEPVLVSGLPSEVTMFAFGRQGHARVELSGRDAAVAALTGSPLGF